MKKKVFTLVITLALILSMIPVSAFAADGAENDIYIFGRVSGDLEFKILSGDSCSYASEPWKSFESRKEGPVSFEIKSKYNRSLGSVQIYSGPEFSFWDECTTLEGEFFPNDEGVIIATVNLEKGKTYAIKYKTKNEIGIPIMVSGDLNSKLLSDVAYTYENGRLIFEKEGPVSFEIKIKREEYTLKSVQVYSSSESALWDDCTTLEGEFFLNEDGIVTATVNLEKGKTYIIKYEHEVIWIPILYSGDISVDVKSDVPYDAAGLISVWKKGKINLNVKSDCDLYLKSIKVYSGVCPESLDDGCDFDTLEGEFPVDSTGTANVQLDLVDGRAYTIEEELQDDPVSGTVQQELTKLKPVVSTSKTSKGIKVTYKAKTGSISKIKKYGGKVQYKIYRATQKNGKYTLKKTTTSSSYTDTSVKKGKKYYYKVRVYVKDADGRLIGSTALSKSNAGSRVYK